MFRIILNILLIVGLALTLFMVTKIWENTHEEYYTGIDHYVFGEGNATQEVRQEILEQLKFFQQGYEARDTSILKTYMDQLFSKEDILILGTMPNEIYAGYSAATELVLTDWLYWGDVRFLIENSKISVVDSVAWISTIGNVEFDLSRFLNLPLRLSGVMVKEDQTWKFHQAQFQFDLDSSWILGIIFLLSIMLLVSMIRLVFMLINKDKGGDLPGPGPGEKDRE